MSAKKPEPSYYHLLGTLQEATTRSAACEAYGVSLSTIKLWMRRHRITQRDYVDQLGEDGHGFVEYLIAREEQESDDAR